MENWLPRHRITVDEYYRMAQVGLLAQDARVELIEGEIIDMTPIGDRHAGTLAQLTDLLSRVIERRAMLRVQLPVRLSRLSEPQPDLVLVQSRADYYKTGHPTSADVLLIVEVSDSTLRYDTQIKVPLYARHGIPEVWVVDLQAERIHYLRSPSGEKYIEESSESDPRAVEVAAFPGLTVDLSQVLRT